MNPNGVYVYSKTFQTIFFLFFKFNIVLFGRINGASAKFETRLRLILIHLVN